MPELMPTLSELAEQVKDSQEFIDHLIECCDGDATEGLKQFWLFLELQLRAGLDMRSAIASTMQALTSQMIAIGCWNP